MKSRDIVILRILLIMVMRQIVCQRNVLCEIAGDLIMSYVNLNLWRTCYYEKSKRQRNNYNWYNDR